MYGYCLEPPNVCIIMELLPTSLKEMLYGSTGRDGAGNATKPTAPSHSASLGNTSSSGPTQLLLHNGSLLPHQQSSATTTQMLLAGNSFAQPLSPCAAGALSSSAASAASPRSDAHALVSVGSEGFDGRKPSSITQTNMSGLTEASALDMLPALPASAPEASPLTLLQAVQLACDVAAGLAYLHASSTAAGKSSWGWGKWRAWG